MGHSQNLPHFLFLPFDIYILRSILDRITGVILKAEFVFISAVMLLSLAVLSSASYVNMTEPYSAMIMQNGSVYLGKVGPGQTFYITISAATTNSTGAPIAIGWDELFASSLPNGWITQNSPLYGAYPSVKVTIAPQEPNGTYTFNLTAVNFGNYSKVGAIKMRAYVNVTPDVFKLSVSPSSVTAGPGEPSSIYVTINNTGVSDSPFSITVHGLPGWNSSRTVIALHSTTGQFAYPIYENEPNVYHLQVYVSSVSSPLIYKQSNITLTTKATLAGDYSALGQGTLIFPIVYAPAYSVMYIISLIARYI